MPSRRLSDTFGTADCDDLDLDIPTFTRRPRHLVPIVHEPSSAIVDVHFKDDGQPVPFDHGYSPRLSRASHWTAAPPTAPGFWFCRALGVQQCTVVRVFAKDNGALWFGWSDLPARRVTTPGLEWSSQPLRVPDDMETTA